MAVQTEFGPHDMTGQPQINFRGKKVGIKTVFVDGLGSVYGLVYNEGTSVWDISRGFVEFDDLFTPDTLIERNGNTENAVRNVILPKINEWLAVMFTPSDTPISSIEKLDIVLMGIRFTSKEDGTVVASL
jgi:hypothetical protein